MPQAKSLRLIFCPNPVMVTELTSDCLVLIDGFNLYHSLREIEKDTGHKVRWLDVRALSQLLIKRLFPNEACPYPQNLLFTAHARHEDDGHQNRQREYYQCLKRLRISIVDDGEWASKTVDLRHHFKDAPESLRSQVLDGYRLVEGHQEKGTDVSIAAHLMHLGPRAKWVCLISGDADLLPALRLFEAVNPGVSVGVARPYGRENRKFKNYHCTDISPQDCLACLLPDPAPTKKRTVRKPPHW